MTLSDDPLRRDPDMLKYELKVAGATFRSGERSVVCPFHEDSSPSGSLYQDDKGIWRYICHAASCGFFGDIFDVRARASNKPLKDVVHSDEPMPREKPRVYASIEEVLESFEAGSVEATYLYTNPDSNNVDLAVIRYRTETGKCFSQATAHKGGFIRKMPPKPWPLFNRSGIRDAKAVVVVEGEKCATALISVGFPATTAPCGAGAGKASHTDWSVLSGKKVYLWPDNDKGGVQFMQDVRKILDDLEPAATCYWVDPESCGVGDKGDAADFIGSMDGQPIEDIDRAVRGVLLSAKSQSSFADLCRQMHSEMDGTRQAIQWKWPKIGNLTKALLPGTATILCGPPGSTKTMFLLEAFAHWHAMGIPVALNELEEDKTHHLRRVLAQLCRKSDMNDDVWVRDNSEEASRLMARHGEFIDSFGHRITANQDNAPTADELLAWITRKAEGGCRILGIDPITAANFGDKPWDTEKDFLAASKRILTKTGASLIMATHPKKGAKSKGLELGDLAGSAAYERFAQTVLWLNAHDSKSATFASEAGEFAIKDFNRSLLVNKARNGKGNGAVIGYNFMGESLTFSERGLVVKKGESNVEQYNTEPTGGWFGSVD